MAPKRECSIFSKTNKQVVNNSGNLSLDLFSQSAHDCVAHSFSILAVREHHFPSILIL